MLFVLFAISVYGVGLQTYGLTYGLYVHRGCSGSFECFVGLLCMIVLSVLLLLFSGLRCFVRLAPLKLSQISLDFNNLSR